MFLFPYSLEARPETGFLAVSRTITPLFPTHDFPERAFLDGPLGIVRGPGQQVTVLRHDLVGSFTSRVELSI